MPRCVSDDCDQAHCKRCGCHTAGNVLIGDGSTGYCQSCSDEDDREQQERFDREWLRRIATGN
jgi:hypothetical protein